MTVSTMTILVGAITDRADFSIICMILLRVQDSLRVKLSLEMEVPMSNINLVGSGVDTLILNVRYCDSKGFPLKQELDEKLAQELDYLQNEARRVETAIATDWVFQEVLLFVEPHGAGKQWRWLLTSRLLTVVVSRGTFNDVIAQVRFSSEYL